jgi:hypothetical protein
VGIERDVCNCRKRFGLVRPRLLLLLLLVHRTCIYFFDSARLQLVVDCEL